MEYNLRISKLDAAKRQLETAIRLYFNDADHVSIHTLAGAAHGILTDLNKKHNGQPMLLGEHLVKNEAKVKFRRLLNEAKNHFKHADKNPEESIDFNHSINDIFIYDACMKYQELTGEIVPYFTIFAGWFRSRNTNLFILSNEELKEYARVKTYKSKYDFFSAMLSASGYLR